jgi:hypothetical protein
MGTTLAPPPVCRSDSETSPILSRENSHLPGGAVLSGSFTSLPSEQVYGVRGMGSDNAKAIQVLGDGEMGG